MSSISTINASFFKDFYKCDHRRQYPEGTTMVYSNMTARGVREPLESVQKVVVFGLQYFIKEYLITRWNETFFKRPKKEVISEYKRIMDNCLGPGAIPVEHLEELHDLGYLPIKIKALPEGSLVPIRVPFFTIHNTNPKFFWLTNMLETITSNATWMMYNNATISYEYRKMFNHYGRKTSDMMEFIPFQGHDFSMRGMPGGEAAIMSGMAHLINFFGTDTIPSIVAHEMYYGADVTKEMVGCSVPATEHSVMCMGGKESEIETYRRLITQVYPKGIVSVVSDTWDYFAVIKNILPALKPEIMAREGKLVIRPDSGDPVAITLESIKLLWEIFGGTLSSKGYKQLDPHIGLIYGDSITLDRCKRILDGLEKMGFASTNVVLGIGSYTYQHNTRDTLGQAIKSTYGEVNGERREIFKTPKTDSGLKNSAKGLLRINADYTLSQGVTWKEEGEGLLETVFENGEIKKEYKLSEIRARLASYDVPALVLEAK